MTTLGDELRAVTASGCTGVTLWPADGKWQAGVRWGDGWSIGVDADPVAALQKALRTEPPAPPPQQEDPFG